MSQQRWPLRGPHKRLNIVSCHIFNRATPGRVGLLRQIILTEPPKLGRCSRELRPPDNPH